MQITIARFLIFLFHPLLMPLYVLLILLYQVSFFSLMIPAIYMALIIALVILSTVLFPLFVIYLLYRTKIITAFFRISREERTYPILCAAIFYYLTYYLFKEIHFSGIFSYYMLGSTLLALIALILNFYHKISLYLISIGGFTGLFLGLSLNLGTDFSFYIFTGILLSGLLGFARLKMNAHHPAEIYSGFLLGVSIMSVLMSLL